MRVMTVELGHDLVRPACFRRAGHKARGTDAVRCGGVPAQPDSIGAAGVGPACEFRRPLRAGSGQPGEGPQRAPLRHHLDPHRRRGCATTCARCGPCGRCWETRGKLDFDSPNYKLSLMTPDFSPEPTGLPMVPVTIAAVGEAMLRVAGQVADGVRLHPLCSRRYSGSKCACRSCWKACAAPAAVARISTCTAVALSLPAPTKQRLRRACSARGGVSGSMARRAPICRSWPCTDCRIWARSCIACRWKGTGTEWRTKCRTTWCASSPPAHLWRDRRRNRAALRRRRGLHRSAFPARHANGTAT